MVDPCRPGILPEATEADPRGLSAGGIHPEDKPPGGRRRTAEEDPGRGIRRLPGPGPRLLGGAEQIPGNPSPGGFFRRHRDPVPGQPSGDGGDNGSGSRGRSPAPRILPGRREEPAVISRRRRLFPKRRGGSGPPVLPPQPAEEPNGSPAAGPHGDRPATPAPAATPPPPPPPGGGFSHYLAYSVLRVSRMTLTRICPGYSICSSMRLAISLAMTLMPSSVTSSGFTMMRTSRPDWMA